MFKTIKDLREFCASENILMVDFIMTDIDGRTRHLSMPADRFTEDTMKYGIGFDASNYGFAPAEKSDMVFIPDISTAHIDPFTEISTLAMIGDVYMIDENRRFDQYPRCVALSAEKYMLATGIADEIRIGPEFEFYVFDHVDYEVTPRSSGFNIDAEQAEWNTGDLAFNLGYKTTCKGGYHIALPSDVLYNLRSKMAVNMEKQGIKVKYHHHEAGGAGQLEIEVEFGGLKEMADKTMLSKYIIRNTAVSEGRTVTFMPKPILNEAGSGLHVHIHLFKDGLPIFYDENGYSQLSRLAHYFMGGLLKHSSALCAFTCPSTNSYKRLSGDKAPVVVGYAASNRSAIIRIPSYAKDPMHKRFEFRSPDGTCNPYYAYAAILMAGLDGIANETDPAKEGYGPYDCNQCDLPKEEQKKINKLPLSLDNALCALEEDNEFLLKSGVFPKRLIDAWIAKKRSEFLEVSMMPTPIEYKKYFDL